MLHEIHHEHLELAFSRHFLHHYTYPPPSRWSYGLLEGHFSYQFGRRHAQTPCDFGFMWPRNVRCHQGHWSSSWHIWPQIEVYRVETPTTVFCRKHSGAEFLRLEHLENSHFYFRTSSVEMCLGKRSRNALVTPPQ